MSSETRARRDRVHRRGVPGQSRARAAGPGPCPAGHYASGAERPPPTSAWRSPRRSRRCATLHPEARGGHRGGERLDLRRQVLHRRLVARVAAAGLEELAEQAGGQPRSVGATLELALTSEASVSLALGQGALGRPLERPGRRAGHGGGRPWDAGASSDLVSAGRRPRARRRAAARPPRCTTRTVGCSRSTQGVERTLAGAIGQFGGAERAGRDV